MNSSLILRGRQPIVIALAACAMIGCSTTPPTIDVSSEAKATFDGLYPVKNSRMDEAWALPDMDLSQYSKIMLVGAGIEYRPGGESGRAYYARSSTHFAVSEEQKSRFRQVLLEAFFEELGKSERFEVVSEAGPDVLMVKGTVLDVVSYVPPDQPGQSDIYLSKVGEATLVLEIRDSITEAIFARSVDRRAAESRSMNFTNSNRVTNRAEVRRVALYWAQILRGALEEQMGAAG
jgi:hypothetical protein